MSLLRVQLSPRVEGANRGLPFRAELLITARAEMHAGSEPVPISERIERLSDEIAFGASMVAILGQGSGNPKWS